MQTWVQKELEHSCLADQRLDKRGEMVLEALSQNPSGSIPAACQGHAETMGAYRFFENEAVTCLEVLESHFIATRQRIRRQDIVILAQDSSEFDVTRPESAQMDGVGPLGTSEARWGIHCHNMIAMTPQKLMLGNCAVNFWARDVDQLRANKALSANERRRKKEQRPIQEKESYRWIEGYRQACLLAEEVEGTQLVLVSDSECDIYEFIDEAYQRQSDTSRPAANWIMRAAEDRRLCPSAGEVDHGDRLWERLEQAPVLGHHTLEVSRQKGSVRPTTRKREQPRSGRTTTLGVQSATVEIRAPQRPGGRMPNRTVNAVLLREVDPPSGEAPLEWLLLTDLPVETLEEALLVMEYYSCRWTIEVFYRTLKTGCRVEQRKFEYRDRYEPCLAMYMIIAWRIMYVTMLSRVIPQMRADRVFTALECAVIGRVMKGKRVAKTTQPRLLGDMVAMIASLGGYLNRKHDPPPGPKAIWIGLARLSDFVLAAENL